jgi:hypothetical protein
MPQRATPRPPDGLQPWPGERTVSLAFDAGRFLVDSNSVRIGLGDQLLFSPLSVLPLSGALSPVFARRSQVLSGVKLMYGGRLGAADAVTPAQARGYVVLFDVPRTASGAPIVDLWRYPELLAPYGATERAGGAAALLIQGLELLPAGAVARLRAEYVAPTLTSARLALPPTALISRITSSFLWRQDYQLVGAKPGEFARWSTARGSYIEFQFRTRQVGPRLAVAGTLGWQGRRPARGSPTVLYYVPGLSAEDTLASLALRQIIGRPLSADTTYAVVFAPGDSVIGAPMLRYASHLLWRGEVQLARAVLVTPPNEAIRSPCGRAPEELWTLGVPLSTVSRSPAAAVATHETACPRSPLRQ